MPGAPRPNNKAKEIALRVLGKLKPKKRNKKDQVPPQEQVRTPINTTFDGGLG